MVMCPWQRSFPSPSLSFSICRLSGLVQVRLPVRPSPAACRGPHAQPLLLIVSPSQPALPSSSPPTADLPAGSGGFTFGIHSAPPTSQHHTAHTSPALIPHPSPLTWALLPFFSIAAKVILLKPKSEQVTGLILSLKCLLNSPCPSRACLPVTSPH